MDGSLVIVINITGKVRINIGRNRQCKDNIGGIIKVYLFSFVKYSRSQIIRNGLELITFPETEIYEFSTVNPTFSEKGNEDLSVNQDFNFDLIGYSPQEEILKTLKKDCRVIIKDRNGQYRLLGAYNGLITDISKTTGGTQSEFGGFNVKFEGLELSNALFFDNLEDVGFNQTSNYIFQNDNNYIFQDGNNYIFN